MTPSVFLTLLLIAASISSMHGQNTTVAPTKANASLGTNLVTAASEVTPNQTMMTTTANASHPTTVVPGVKKGECHDFKVFILNNQLSIPYTITCCIIAVGGIYLVLFGKLELDAVESSLQVLVLVLSLVPFKHLLSPVTTCYWLSNAWLQSK